MLPSASVKCAFITVVGSVLAAKETGGPGEPEAFQGGVGRWGVSVAQGHLVAVRLQDMQTQREEGPCLRLCDSYVLPIHLCILLSKNHPFCSHSKLLTQRK